MFTKVICCTDALKCATLRTHFSNQIDKQIKGKLMNSWVKNKEIFIGKGDALCCYFSYSHNVFKTNYMLHPHEDVSL